MICPKCNKKMLCTNTYNDKKKMKTARSYKCSECGDLLFTMESKANILKVLDMLAKRWSK